MGKVWNDEMEEIRKKKKTIYQSPLPRKKQLITQRGRAGKVKVYTEEEIFLFNMQQQPRLFDY